MPTDPARAQAVFLAVAEVTDPAARALFLAEACGRDLELKARVEALLRAHDQADSLLDAPLVVPRDPYNAATRDFSPLNPDAAASQVPDGLDPAADRESFAFLSPSTRPDSLGRIGHYEVLQVLGKGGFGIVFRAFDEQLHRLVAIKVMNPEMAATSPPRKRFLREARSAAAVKHENVVQVYSVEEQPLPYMVMEYVEGQTLQDKLDAGGPLNVLDILHLGRQMASGLTAAHAQYLIHRDIKPSNILIEAGADQKVKITDFGLARAADDATLTRTGVICGTPMFMAPEQAHGAALDHRTDLFSLGSVLYQMTSGRPPFRAPTAIAVLRRVTDESPRPIREIIPEVPDWLCAIIAKLQAKEPGARFQSAKEVADLLARCQTSLQQHGRVELPFDPLPFLSVPPKTTTPDPSAVEIAPKKSAPLPEAHAPRRHRWSAAAAVLVAVFAGLGMTEATGVTNVRGTVVRLFSPDGTLVVEVDDPGVSVSIDGEEMVITGTGVKEIRLKPGQYKVLASKGGKPVMQELVTVARNGRQVVRVHREAMAGEIDTWLQSTTALPTAKQVEAVTKKLKELNPKFDGQLKYIVEGGAVSQLEMSAMGVTDISPLRAFSGLKQLSCPGPWNQHAELSDLTPLTGMKLVKLNCSNTSVSDLTPLMNSELVMLNCNSTNVIDLTACRTMKLEELYCCETPVADLSPLKGMRLKKLYCACRAISDLSPLQGMPLRSLGCDGSRVTDLTPLQGMGLTELSLYHCRVKDLTPIQGMKLTALVGEGPVSDFNPLKGMPLQSLIWWGVDLGRDAAFLREIKTLESINSKPAAVFWKEIDSAKAATSVDEAWLQSVAALSTAKQVEAVAKKLKELNPDFDGKLTHAAEGGVVTQLEMSAVGVTDLSPLRAFRGLKELRCRGEWGKPSVVLADLSPLSGMKLTLLDCAHTSVSDLTPLKNSELVILNVDTTRIVDLTPLRKTRLEELNLTATPFIDLSQLKGMPLKKLSFGATAINDLSPLAGMKLQRLDCGGTGISNLTPLRGMELTELYLFRSRVSDLSPLKGMKLKTLVCSGTRVSDLSPVKDMPLRELSCEFKPERDTEILRSIKTLEQINFKPAAEFWKEVGQKK
ncbi:MAG: protein kinase [Planctomycetes bacterium]|nr:protein kinase [Planctomycetota bacterium]